MRGLEIRLKMALIKIVSIIDDSSSRRNFDLDKKNETITIAGKSILK